MNPNVEKAINYATIAGAVILVAGATRELVMTKPSLKTSTLPVVSILVGIAAFNYALKSTQPIVFTRPSEETV